MKQILSLVVILALPHLIQAEMTEGSLTTKPASTLQNVFAQGNMELRGGFSGSQIKSKTNGSSQTYSVYPSLEYFVIDDLSVGGSISYSEEKDDSRKRTSLGIGPSLTYYFAKAGITALYLNQRVVYFQATTSYSTSSNSDEQISDNLTMGTSSLGAKFILVPRVAFGIGLEYSYDLAHNDYFDRQMAVVGSFSFYY